MSENFKISDDFAAYEAETMHAAQEAAKAEKMVMGINIPVNTIGKASILGFDAGKSKIKTDPKTKQQTGGHPMITLSFHVNEPAQYAGQKINLYFTLHATPTQTVQQKYQRLYDCLEDCGMPRELRGKPLAEIAKWCGTETRSFNYEVVPHWQNPQDKEFKPQGVGGSMPSLTDLETAAGAPNLVAGETVKVAGNDATILALQPNGMVEVQFPNGQKMSVPSANVTKG
jgi:hypothetical protein